MIISKKVITFSLKIIFIINMLPKQNPELATGSLESSN